MSPVSHLQFEDFLIYSCIFSIEVVEKGLEEVLKVSVDSLDQRVGIKILV